MASLNVKVIRDSFDAVKPIADDVVTKFYEILWRDYPAAKGVFANVDMDNQRKLLINSLVYIVDNLENSEKLITYLKRMGKRHVNYGTEPEHYDWVGASLLKAFSFFLGSDWTPRLKEQWTIAYGVIAETMKEGAKEATKPTATPKDNAVSIFDGLENDGDIKELARIAARKILREAMEEEILALFNKKGVKKEAA
jgi:hemoglobin-like flavoprotein